MADDFQVKQSSSSSGAYGLTGGVLGGLGAGAAAHYFTKPKYGSYEEIIAESKDSFDKKIEAAEGEEKEFLKQAKDAAGKYQAALDEYNKKFDEWKEKNPATVKEETEDFKKTKAAQTEAEKAYETANKELEAKRTQFINEKTEELKASNKGELTEGQKKANEAFKRELEGKKNNLKNYVEARENAYKKVNEYISRSADEGVTTSRLEQAFDIHKKRMAVIDDITEKLKLNDKNAKPGDRNYNFKKGTQIRLSNGKVVRLVPGKRLTEEEIKTLREQLADARRAADKALEDKIQNNPALKDSFGQIRDKKQRMQAANEAKDNIVNTRQMVENADARQRFYDREYANYEREKANIKMSDVEFERSKKALEIKKTKLENTQAIRDAIRLEQLESYTTGTHKGRRVAGWLGFEYPNKLTDAQREEYAKLKAKLAESPLSEAQKKKVEQLISDGGYKGAFKTIDGELIGLQSEIRALEPKVNAEAVARRNVNAFEEIMRGMSERKGKLELKVEVPVSGDKELERIEKSIRQTEAKFNIPGAGLSEAEIAEKAGKYADEKMATETANVANLKKLAEEAKAKTEAEFATLKDGKALTDAEREAAFLKELGVDSKEKYAEKAAEDAKENLKKNYKKFIERKYGFAEHANWKIAGVAAAGALVVGAIASALAPKHN